MPMVKNGLLERGREVMMGLGALKIKNHLIRLDVMKAKKAIVAATDDYLEVKNELIIEFGKATEEGYEIGPETPGLEKFTTKINELLNAETEFSPTILPERALSFIEDLSVEDLEILEICGIVSFEEDAPIALVEDSEDVDDSASG